MATISGTVWLHAADGVKAYANPVGGWTEFAGGGSWSWGTTDAGGRYTFPAPIGARVRIQFGGQVNVYQPCAVTLQVEGNVSRDLHVVNDVAQLGARLPSQLMVQTPRLSGVVYAIEEGRRTPISEARVELDGLYGLGLVTATTLTDRDGRYVLCGLDGERNSTYLFATKAGYALFSSSVAINGNTVLDIEMRP